MPTIAPLGEFGGVKLLGLVDPCPGAAVVLATAEVVGAGVVLVAPADVDDVDVVLPAPPDIDDVDVVLPAPPDIDDDVDTVLPAPPGVTIVVMLLALPGWAAWSIPDMSRLDRCILPASPTSRIARTWSDWVVIDK